MNSTDRIPDSVVEKEPAPQLKEKLWIDARFHRGGSGIYRNAFIYFALALLLAVIGFFPSYFGNLRNTDAVHHFHGIVATIWMLGLITQSWLIRERMISAHRTIGRMSLLVAPLFVISGLLVVHVMLTKNDEASLAFGERLAFIDIITMCYFSVAYSLAIRFRRKTQLHARYMASTAILLLPPTLVRVAGFIPGIDSFEAALHGSYFICEAIVAILLFDDYRHGGIRAPYLILLTVLVLQHVSFLVSPSFSWWTAAISWVRNV